MMAFAPPRLSTTSGWPSALSTSFAMALALASVAPPGGNGTISRIGRVGHACCAPTSAAMNTPHASVAMDHDNKYRAFMFFLLKRNRERLERSEERRVGKAG